MVDDMGWGETGMGCQHTTWVNIGLNSRKCTACHEVRFKSVGRPASTRPAFKQEQRHMVSARAMHHRW
jgi:hypothetical protein